MPVSIAQAQANLLANDGLDNLGTENFTESLTALEQLAGLLIQNVQTNLNESGQISSGALSDSFVASPPKEGAVTSIDISALDYYDYQNKGVQGTKSGSSLASYAFKNSYPSTAMVTAIQAWIDKGKASTANVKKTVSAIEDKNKSISALDKAYVVSRAIKMHGIKGTGYFDKAVKTTQDYAQTELGQALAADIINMIPKDITPQKQSTT